MKDLIISKMTNRMQTRMEILLLTRFLKDFRRVMSMMMIFWGKSVENRLKGRLRERAVNRNGVMMRLSK